MNEQKSFLVDLAETIDRHLPRRAPRTEAMSQRHNWLRWMGRQMIPNIGTLVLVGILLLVVPSLAAPSRAPSATSTSTVSYQGRLADSGGLPITGKQNMEFRLYDAPTGGVPLWTEMWTGGNAVDVSDGLFNVMLGSMDNTLASAIQGYDELYLGITVGTDSEMSPRVQLGSVPFSMQAMTVPDGAITSAKLADDAVTSSKITSGAVGSSEIASSAVGTTEITDGAVTQAKAPTLLKSANGQNEIIRSGNTVFSGSDAEGLIKVTYSCFPNGARVFMATNGHWNANHSYVIAHGGVGRCGTTIKLSSPTGNPIRINWIAIGN